MTCPICKGVGYFRKEVPLEHPDFGKAIACECTAETNRQLRIAAQAGILQKFSRLGNDQRRWTLDNFPGDAGARDVARLAYQTKHGLWVFYGSYGVGKTGLMAAVCNALNADGFTALYQQVPMMLDRLRAGYRDSTYQDLLDALIATPALALDEFGGHGKGAMQDDLTAWAYEKLFILIDERYSHWDEQLTLVATNRAPDKGDSDPIWSRFADKRVSHLTEVKGRDIRQEYTRAAANVIEL